MSIKHGILLRIVCKLCTADLSENFLTLFIGLKFIYVKVIQMTEVELRRIQGATEY